MTHQSFLLRLKLLLQTLSRQKRTLSLAITGLLVLSIVVTGVTVYLDLFNSQPAFAQSFRIRNVGQQVYKQLPELPLENQYVNKETGEIDSDNTLVNRLISYHVYVKGRAPNYRLDWKLTLADYLGANEIMQEGLYPGNETLRENPIEGDRAAIKHLNRQQRDALVQTLVSIFNPNYSTPASKTPSQPSTTPSPVPQPNSP